MRWLVMLFFVFLTGCNTLSEKELINQYERGSNNKALAVSKNGSAGASWGGKTIQDAMNKALRFCRKSRGVQCRVVSVNGVKSSVKYNPNTDKLTSISNSSDNLNKYTCAELSQKLAYEYLYQGHSYLDRDGDGHPCEWGKNSRSKKTYSKTVFRSSNCHWVKSHTRNGKKVRGYRRCS